MTIGLAMYVTGMMANPLTANSSTATDLVKPPTVETAQTENLATHTVATNEEKSSENIHTNAGIEKQVRSYFADIPLLANIARCESHYQQYDKDGSIFRGIVNNKDVGVMQINEHYHLGRAKQLGIDIYTIEGNLKYARLLYEENGSDPWISSSPCWGGTIASSKVQVQVAPVAVTVTVGSSTNVVEMTTVPVPVTGTSSVSIGVNTIALNN